MAQTALYAEKYAYVDFRNENNSHTNALQPILTGPRFLLRFPELPQALKYRRVTEVGIEFGVSGHGQAGVLSEVFLSTDFNPETVTIETVPTSDDALEYSVSLVAGVPAISTPFETNVGATLAGSNTPTPIDILKNRTCIFPSFYKYRSSMGSSSLSIFTPLYSGGGQEQYIPHLVVSHSDQDIGADELAIQAPDYINPHVDNVLRWDYSLSRNTMEALSVVSETFYWKESSASSYSAVSVVPGSKSVQIPAGTFPAASSVDYYVEVVCNSGVLAASSVVNSSTADSIPTASPAAPISTVETADSEILMTWTVSNDSGSLPTKSDLQYSTNGGISWADLATISGSTTEYTVPANTFTAGQINWRVRAYNIDDVAGPWGESSFIAFGAPPAPSVQSDAVPFATISWQSTGQEAYQLELDGVLLGTFFGYGRQYKLQTPLEDGSHVARVRVQNAYGLWSQYGEASFSITNDPGGEIALDGTFAVDAALFWISADLTADFLIFRDGALIGHTAGDRFTDRFVLGAHSYYVINRLPSGNYSRSNTVEGKMCTRRPLIALLSGGEWLPLRYSERSMTQQSFTWQKTHSLRHIAGATFPVLELSPYEDLSGAYDAAFLCPQDAERFYRLRGQVVVLKSKGGKVLIGAITSISEIVNTFYQACQFTLEQIHWEDYVDDANG